MTLQNIQTDIHTKTCQQTGGGKSHSFTGLIINHDFTYFATFSMLCFC